MARQRHAERVAAESLEGATLSDNTPVEAKMTSLTLKSVEEEEQKQVFMAFARIYSGMVKKGQRVFVLGPKYDPTQGLSLLPERCSASDCVPQVPHLSCCTLENLYLLMGRELEELEEVPAGNVLGKSVPLCLFDS
ncbi:hypothetical protein XENOCAPTIV_012969 [Xenoophorus captivus]|uniref:Uncharacterized protein n=1 Tax=Xenoophorus captivus TaxID=1517983 RepID=A0ABV0QRK5_9TELE